MMLSRRRFLYVGFLSLFAFSIVLTILALIRHPMRPLNLWQVVVLLSSGIAAAAAAAALVLVRRLLLHTPTRGELKRLQASLGAMWGLNNLICKNEQLFPALEGSAMGIRAAHALASLVMDRQLNNVVELGPGASTSILHLAREKKGVPFKLYAVEHDEFYEGRLETLLQRLNSQCQLILAPLERLSIGQWSGEWYSIKALQSLPSSIDLLVVDGPPNHVGDDSRYPAYPVLRGRLRSGSIILVDDADRRSEREMVERWMDEGGIRVMRDGHDFVVLEFV